MIEIIWIRSQTGTFIPYVYNSIFHRNRKTQNTKTYWKCSHRNCSVRLINEGDVFYAVEGTHMHTSNVNKIYILEMKEFTQYKIHNRPHLIGQEAFNKSLRDLSRFYNFDMSILYIFPSFDSLKTSIYRFEKNIFPSSILNVEDCDASYF
ncbi:hypothetical protein DMUE_3570 [Dictyocoela muelleri]|nr:hypothetical protein DMUE_3570 [Dictyocoela muelleri]